MTQPRGPGFILLTACLLHAIAIGGGYMSLPPLFGQISADQHWSMEGLQRAWSMIPLGSAFAAVLTGASLRKHADRCTLLFSGMICVAGLLLRATSTSLVQFSLALFLFGLGTGSMLVILTSRVSHQFPRRHAGLAQALFFGSYTVGAAIGLMSAEVLAQRFSGWRDVFLVWSALSALALLPALLTNRLPATPDERGSSTLPSPDWLRQIAPLAVVYGCYVGGYLGVVGLLPHQLRQWGWTATTADSALAGSTLAFLAGAAVWAGLTDRYGRRRLAFVTGMAGSAILVMVTLISARDGPDLIATAAVVLIGFCGGTMALFFPILLDSGAAGGANAARSIGVATAASYVGGFLLPFIAAPFATTHPQMSLAAFGLSFGVAGLVMATTGNGRR